TEIPVRRVGSIATNGPAIGVTSSAASMPIATSITARRATPSISAAGTLTVTIQPDIGERVKAW
ncbi:hypothetical protein LTR94_035679, partial [Friedmanniomyces endolithicus]